MCIGGGGVYIRLLRFNDIASIVLTRHFASWEALESAAIITSAHARPRSDADTAGGIRLKSIKSDGCEKIWNILKELKHAP